MIKQQLLLTFFILALLLSSSTIANVDFYLVLEVEGNITNIQTKESLEQGDNLSSEAKVKFGAADAYAMLHSRTQGRFQLKAAEQKAKPGAELMVREGLLAMNTVINTRAGKITDLNALRLHFKSDEKPYLILGGKTELEMSQELIDKFGEGFFFIRYEYKGNAINKRLPMQGNVVTIAESELFKIDNQAISDPENAKNFMISFYRSTTKDAYYLEDAELKKHLYFDLKFLSKELLKKKGAFTLVNYLKQEKESQENMLKAVKNLLSDLGAVEDDNLKTWLKDNF